MMRIFITLLTCFLCTFDARASGLPSPIDYFGAPDYRNFSISPSGRYLAAARDLPLDEINYDKAKPDDDRRQKLTSFHQGAGDQLIIYDFVKSAVVGKINVQGRMVHWLHWATDERLLVSISTVYSLNIGRDYTFELPAARTVSMTPFNKGEAVVLFAEDRAVNRQNLFLSNVVDPLPDDPDHVLMSAFKRGDLDLWRVNIVTGDAERVATGTPRTFGWVADARGRPAFRLDRNANGTVMTVFARQDKNRWRKIIATRLNEDGYGAQFRPIARGAKENEMYVLTAPPGQERAAVAIYNLESGALSQPVLEHPEFDLSGGLTDPHTGAFFGAWRIADRYHTSFLDENLQKHMEGINEFFDNDANVVLVAASRDLKRLLLDVSGPDLASEIYAYDRDARQIDPLFYTRPKLLDKHVSPVEIMTVTARDGMAFRAYLTHPDGVGRDEPAPLVVMPHGGPAARDYYRFDPMAQFLASRGYRVLQPNFRGSSGYGSAFRQAGYGEWGGKMQTDMLDAFHQIRDRGLVKDGKACVMGGSYGGYAALYAAMATPEEFVCAISIAGVTDLIDLLDHERRQGRDAYEYAVRQIGDPRKDKDMLIARSPARNAGKIGIPLLLIHGRHDTVVPYNQLTKLTGALNEAGKKYVRYVVSDGHQFAKESSTVQSMRRVERFLARHLGGASD